MIFKTTKIIIAILGSILVVNIIIQSNTSFELVAKILGITFGLIAMAFIYGFLENIK